MKEINFEPQYKNVFWEYFSVNKVFFLNKIFVRILLTMSLLFIFLDIFFILTNQKEWNALIEFPTIVFFLFPFIIFLVIFRYTKTILANKKLNEKITITINQNIIKYTGETFYNEYNWTDFIKIKEVKNWFLLYVNKNFAQVIRKADLSSEQLSDLTEIIQSKK